MRSDLLFVWQKIIDELLSLQIKEGKYSGHIKNPIVNNIYLRESAFASKIFIINYILTCQKSFLYNGKKILNVLDIEFKNNEINFNEPVWTPLFDVHVQNTLTGL